MSKYTACKSDIRVQDKEYLLEAIKIVWKEQMGITLTDADVEFHDEPVYLVGYDGKVRDKNNKQYGEAKANVIIRGAGMGYLDQAQKAALKITGAGVSKMQSADNDFGLLEQNETYAAQVQDYNSSRITRLSNMIFQTTKGLKTINGLAPLLDLLPGTKLCVNGKPTEDLNDCKQQIMKLNSQNVEYTVTVEAPSETPAQPDTSIYDSPEITIKTQTPTKQGQQGQGKIKHPDRLKDLY